jgi:hypothetical protein
MDIKRREVVLKRTVLTLTAAVAVAALALPNIASACELIHLKRVKNPQPTPVVPPGGSLCWTGCPLKIEGEQDSGKGRWIIKKQGGDNSVQGVWTIEKNLNTGKVFYAQIDRSDRTCAEPAEVTAAIAAGAVNFATFGCNTPDFKMKFVDPKVCVDQTLNCAPANRKSVKVFHDFDAMDDLCQGKDVVRDGTTFSHAKVADCSIYFEFCCGDVADYGTPGDPFELDSYAVIKRPDNSCFTIKLREGLRSSGNPLPDPNAPGDCSVQDLP